VGRHGVQGADFGFRGSEADEVQFSLRWDALAFQALIFGLAEKGVLNRLNRDGEAAVEQLLVEVKTAGEDDVGIQLLKDRGRRRRRDPVA
jgi:hypothetical protein